jgi:hypothetical protein
VENTELSGAKFDEKTGMVNWDLQLEPGGKKAVDLKYQVKYPKNKPIALE